MMSENERKLRSAFSEALRMPEDQVNDAVAYGTTKGWDSIAHMTLIASLDSVFDVMIETDDVIALSDYAKARGILAKYGISF